MLLSYNLDKGATFQLSNFMLFLSLFNLAKSGSWGPFLFNMIRLWHPHFDHIKGFLLKCKNVKVCSSVKYWIVQSSKWIGKHLIRHLIMQNGESMVATRLGEHFYLTVLLCVDRTLVFKWRYFPPVLWLQWLRYSGIFLLLI